MDNTNKKNKVTGARLDEFKVIYFISNSETVLVCKRIKSYLLKLKDYYKPK